MSLTENTIAFFLIEGLKNQVARYMKRDLPNAAHGLFGQKIFVLKRVGSEPNAKHLAWEWTQENSSLRVKFEFSEAIDLCDEEISNVAGGGYVYGYSTHMMTQFVFEQGHVRQPCCGDMHTKISQSDIFNACPLCEFLDIGLLFRRKLCGCHRR